MKPSRLERIATSVFLCLCLAAASYLFFIVFIRSQF
jgi:hypothetical protein